jgi:hypothetical protein
MQARNSEPSVYPTDAAAWPSPVSGCNTRLGGVSVPICSVGSPAAAREMRSVVLIWDAEFGWPACTPLQWQGANAGGAQDER